MLTSNDRTIFIRVQLPKNSYALLETGYIIKDQLNKKVCDYMQGFARAYIIKFLFGRNIYREVIIIYIYIKITLRTRKQEREKGANYTYVNI